MSRQLEERASTIQVVNIGPTNPELVAPPYLTYLKLHGTILLGFGRDPVLAQISNAQAAVELVRFICCLHGSQLRGLRQEGAMFLI